MTEVDALSRKKFLMLGPNRVEITEPVPVPVLAVDVFTELRVINNSTVVLSLAAIVADAGDEGTAEARICARLRLSLETVSDIQASLQRIMAELTKAKETAN